MVLRLTFSFLLLMFSVYVKRVHSVPGCITYVTRDDYNEKASICERHDTHFTQIPPTLPKEVTRLTINHQNIKVLGRRQLEHLPNLTYLNLDYNMLSVIKQDAFLPVKKLRELSLRFNYLVLSVDSFHPNALTAVNTLEVLNLKRNPIGRVPANLFYPMRNRLRSLVLAGAGPEFHISTEALEGLFKLEVLDLSYNNLESLPGSFNGLFTTMQLKQLFLFGDPWRCDCTLRWLREWIERHNGTQYFIDPREIDPAGFVIDPLLQMESQSLENAYPKCAAPPRLAGRALFPISNVQTTSLTPSEMACPPKPKRESVVVRGKPGENVTLACEFEASSVDEVLWYQNGHSILSTSNVRVRQIYHGHVLVELFIPGIKETDFGTYTCLLKNDFGKANMSTTLILADSKWSAGATSEAGFVGWLDQFNSNLILKYSLVAALVIIVFLVATGVIFYCFCRRTPKNISKTLANSSHVKTTFTPLSPLNGIPTVTVDGTLSRRRIQPPRYSPSHDMSFTRHPYVLSFQDSHPLYSMAEHGAVEPSPECPVHGITNSSAPFVSSEVSLKSSSPRMTSLERTGSTTYGTVTAVHDVLPPPATSSSVFLVEDTSDINSDYVLCPRHGNVMASLCTPSLGDGTRKEIQASPIVRSTKTIRLNHFLQPSKNAASGINSLKTKHVEFADTPSVTSMKVDDGRVVPVINGDKSTGFVTTV